MRRMLTLTRRFVFSAAHRLASSALSAAEADGAYGDCQRIHGHNFRLEVTVAGDPDPRTGFFCNVLELERLVRELVIAPCDHRLLNEVPLFGGQPPTMEVAVQAFWRVLEPALAARGLRLVALTWAETEDHWVRLEAPLAPGAGSALA